MDGEQVLNQEQREALGIEREWRTKDLIPGEIAEALGGVLEESNDSDSKWNIHLYYGRRTPFLTLKLDPEKRKLHVAIYGPKRKGFFTYRYTDCFYNVEDLWFIQGCEPKTGEAFTDIHIRVRNSGRMDAAGIISNKWHRSFECGNCVN